jgi:uncharacterized protein YdiU (UPF0061 family)
MDSRLDSEPSMPARLPADLGDITFENPSVVALPTDASDDRHPRQVTGACQSRVTPERVPAPRLLGWSHPLAKQLGLLPPSDQAVEILAGNRVLPTMEPFAACYGGHQFGHWAGQLGDGRAITLGELPAPDGSRWEVQLKGPGLTPYSRRGDGRAVLRSSLREFVCSEAMHHLGVPTTRALALVATGESIVRDMFYDGRPELEPGAITTRVAPSFLRFGNYQIHAARGDLETLRRLVDFTIGRYFPDLLSRGERTANPESIAAWYAEVARRTAVMVAHWMRVGFVHGVMNTDNMSVLGLTIDYGPYGWMDVYDPDFTPNTTDAQGRRYRFGNQPAIAQWNLARFGEAIAPLLGDLDPIHAGLAVYRQTFEREHASQMAAKLGLSTLDDPADMHLLVECLDLMQAVETDWTLFFRCLSDVSLDVPGFPDDRGAASPDEPAVAHARQRLVALEPAFYQPPDDTLVLRWEAWLDALAVRVRAQGLTHDERRTRMRAASPAIVPRNYLVHEVIQAVTAGDNGPLEALMQAIQRPFDDAAGHPSFTGRMPEWARDRDGCSALSCSS